MHKPIEGKVATIVSIREVAINVGVQHGVKEGMVFAILSKESLPVIDPEKGIVLGEIDRPKVRVKATDIYGSFSICRTFELIPGTSRMLASYFSAVAGGADRPKTLKVGDSDLPQPLSEEESYVKVGDRVRQVVDTDTAADD